MAHEIQDKAAWQHLADLLIARRVQLGWQTRVAFVKDHEDRLRNDRTITAIEKTERMNFRQQTLALVELLYQWQAGSIDDVLRGRGDPRPIEDIEVVHDRRIPAAIPPVSPERMECRFIIDRLSEDQLPEALAVLRGMERR